MRQKYTTYEDDLDLFNVLSRQVLRALQILAWNLRAGTADEQLLSTSIFSNTTKFRLMEAVILCFNRSTGVNDWGVLRENTTDANIQAPVNAAKDILIGYQKDASRPVVGLTD